MFQKTWFSRNMFLLLTTQYVYGKIVHCSKTIVHDSSHFAVNGIKHQFRPKQNCPKHLKSGPRIIANWCFLFFCFFQVYARAAQPPFTHMMTLAVWWVGWETGGPCARKSLPKTPVQRLSNGYSNVEEKLIKRVNKCSEKVIQKSSGSRRFGQCLKFF